MDFLKQWTLCICVTLCASAVLSVLAPKGSIKRFYKSMLSIFILISFLYPLSTLDSSKFNFSFDDIEINEIDNSYVYENEISNQIEKLLQDKGYVGCKASTSATVSENEITINEITVSISDDYDNEEIKQLIFDSLGVNAKVVYVGD